MDMIFPKALPNCQSSWISNGLSLITPFVSYYAVYRSFVNYLIYL